MRALKNLFTLAIIVVILAGGAGAAFRIARGRPSVPEQIKPGVVAVSSAGAYLYAAKAGAHIVLFDAGADPAGRPIDVAVAALDARRSDITDLFLTHGHPDHTAGAAGLTGAKVHLGEGDVATAEGHAPPDKLLVRLIAKAQSERLKASVRALKGQLAGAEIAAVCAGHGGCTPLGLGRTLLEDVIERVGA